ncbi:MAG: hypothetical protein VB108_06220 [Anaerolineaceae bacterium]|nr:hypothetical protein [Anaerolineaceae bacterium]
MNPKNTASQNDFLSALTRYETLLAPARFEALKACALQPAPSSVRLNLLKCPEPEQFIQHLAASYGWQLKALPFSKYAWQLLNAQTSPGKTMEHQLGYYYIQDAASILPVSLFDQVQKPRLTLDMAASPGGKTTQLVDLQADQDLVIANDSSPSRLKALRSVMDIWGSVNCALTNFPGEKWGLWFPETFDRVLLDAPCSMESLRDSATHPHRPISEAERLRLAERQLALLISGLAATSIGGELVYSTCSLAPEEDEFVLDDLLKRYPNAFEIEQTRTHEYGTAGLLHFEKKHLDPAVEGSLRVWPDSFGTNGFFAAKLIKKASISFASETAPCRPFESTRLEPITALKKEQLAENIHNDYGFSLEDALEKHHLSVFERDAQFIFLPAAWLQTFLSLPYYALGMPLAKLSADKPEVLPDFILRFGDAFTKGFLTLNDAQMQAWLQGLELRNLHYPAGLEGKIIAIRSASNLNLGAGKANPGRLRNLLPHRHLQRW